MEILDVAIIGAGPAGLSAGIYSLERKLKTIVFESNDAGGQPHNLYPDKNIYDFPSYEKITGMELAVKMINHALGCGLKISEETPVEKIEKYKNVFLLKYRNKIMSTKSVILATGMGHYLPRKLQVPGEKEFKEKGIYYQKIPKKVTGKRIIVVGGGDTALENAVSACEKGAYVTLVHRSDQFRAMERTVDRIKSLSIPMYLSSQVKSIRGSDKVEGVEIVKNNGSASLLTADMLVICIGTELNSGFLTSLGLKIAKQAVIVDENMQTSTPGIFACGDVTVPLGKYRRISIACGTAAMAVSGVYQYLKNPDWMKS